MQPYLILGLTATMGAMGELAGHERRGAMEWPARSAILGLIGAALGIRRGGNFSSLDALSMAVAVFDGGHTLRDYHTVQTVPTAVVKKPNSRPEALMAAKSRSNTTITLRDYRAGVFYGVAIWGGDLPPLRAALARPVFTLYFGRKSCPLASPLGAKLVEADSPESALSHLILPPWRQGARAQVLLEAAEIGEEVHDLPVDRTHWHFGPRTVDRRAVDIVPDGGQA